MNVGQPSDVPLKIDEPNLNVLRASIKSPSGKEEPCTLKRLPNGNIGKSVNSPKNFHHVENFVQHV